MTTSSDLRSPLPAYQAASRFPSFVWTTHEAWLCLEFIGKIAVVSNDGESASTVVAKTVHASPKRTRYVASLGRMLLGLPEGWGHHTIRRGPSVYGLPPGRASRWSDRSADRVRSIVRWPRDAWWARPSPSTEDRAFD